MKTRALLVVALAGASAARALAAGTPPSGALPDLPPAPPAPVGSAPSDAGAPRDSAPDRQQQTPPPAPPPPPGYAPPPASGYPPPYPYPYAYPPPYYPYPPAYPVPPPAPKMELPEHAATAGSPFIEGALEGVFLGRRVDEPFAPGVQIGVYVAGRLRLAAHVVTLWSSSGQSADYTYPYVPADQKNPSFVWGVTAGYAIIAGRTFVFAPGLAYMGVDRGYGSFLGASLPFDWVLPSGLRIGFELDAGNAFGGSYSARCDTGVPASECTQGQTAEIARSASQGFVFAFTMGFGFNHPDPEPQRRNSARADVVR